MAASLPQRGGEEAAAVSAIYTVRGGGGGILKEPYGSSPACFWERGRSPRSPTCKVPICCLAMALGGKKKKSSITQSAAKPTLTVTPGDRFFYLTTGIFALVWSANNCLSPRYKCIQWNVKTFLLPSQIALCRRSRIESVGRCAGATRHETVQHKWGWRGESVRVWPRYELFMCVCP